MKRLNEISLRLVWFGVLARAAFSASVSSLFIFKIELPASRGEKGTPYLSSSGCKEGNTLIVAGARRAALSIIVPWFVSLSSSSVRGQSRTNTATAAAAAPGRGWSLFRRSNLTHLSRPSSSMHCQAQANGPSSFLSSPFLSFSLEGPLYPPPPPPPPLSLAASLSFRFVSFRFASSPCPPFFLSSLV